MLEGYRNRLLASQELRHLALEIGQLPHLWKPLAKPQPDARHFEQLFLDDSLGIWVLSWMSGHDTGFHDHDISSGAFTVVEGHLREERMRIGAPASVLQLEVGVSTHFSPKDIHRVAHEEGEVAVSIHAYSPPLKRMGSYSIAEDGALQRTPLGPVEELRPLAGITIL